MHPPFVKGDRGGFEEKMILQKIVENRREEVARQKEILPLGELRQMLADRPPTRDFEGAIRDRGCAVIAEVKRSSPSKGLIREDFNTACFGDSDERRRLRQFARLFSQCSTCFAVNLGRSLGKVKLSARNIMERAFGHCGKLG